MSDQDEPDSFVQVSKEEHEVHFARAYAVEDLPGRPRSSSHALRPLERARKERKKTKKAFRSYSRMKLTAELDYCGGVHMIKPSYPLAQLSRYVPGVMRSRHEADADELA